MHEQRKQWPLHHPQGRSPDVPPLIPFAVLLQHTKVINSAYFSPLTGAPNPNMRGT